MVPAVSRGPWILVTGAGGFIAHHVIERLLEAGRPVLGLDNLDSFYSVEIKRRNLHDLHEVTARTGTPFEFLQDDVTRLSPDWFRNRDIRKVMHFAAKAGVRPSLRDPQGYLHVNVVGTLKVLEFCKGRGVADLLFASSSSVYGNDSPVPFREDGPADRPISPYAASKRAAEMYCHAYAHLHGLKIAALRLFTVYGPRQRPDLAIHKFADAIAHEHPVTLFGDGYTERDYTYVSDIVDGVFGAMEWVKRAEPGTFDIFNLGGSETTKLSRLVELLENSLGVKARIQREALQPGDVERTHADTSKARNAFGFEPKVRIEDGIQKFVQWYQSWKGPRTKAA